MRTGGARRLLHVLKSTVPTSYGRRVLELSVLFLVTALFTGRPSLYVGASLLLAIYLVAHLGAAYAGLVLTRRWSAPERAFAAEPFPVAVTVRNHGYLAVGPVEVHDPPPGSGGPHAVLPRLGARRTATLEVRQRVRRRGLHRIDAPALSTSWPLMLAYYLDTRASPRSILVYPRRIAVPAWAREALAREQPRPVTTRSAPRTGELFRSIREWAPGDPRRVIAWKATARHGSLMTREFDREDGGRVVVLLDLSPEPRRNRLPAPERRAAVERACSLAASVLLRLKREGRPAVFATYAPDAVRLGDATGPQGLLRALEALALAQAPGPRDPTTDPMTLVAQARLKGSRVLRIVAATGPVTRQRGPGGCTVTRVPSLRASFTAVDR